MKNKFIKDLQFGDKLTGELFVIKNIRKGKTLDGRDYLDVFLADNTGEIQGKIWDNRIEDCGNIKIGDIVSVSAFVEEFRDKQQLRVTFLQLAENYDLADFLPKSQKSIQALWVTLEKFKKGIKDKHLRKLVESFYQDKSTIENAPAGEMLHHAYLGGYLEHISEMLNLVETIYENFDGLDHDLLITGVLLHDIGKLRELGVNHTIFRTTEGALIGHLSLGLIAVSSAIEKIKGFPEELRNKLLHIIASHHGRLEYGSPIKPMTREAIAIYYIDNLSAKMNAANKVFQDNQNSGAEFSDFVFALESKLYLN